MLNVSIVTYHTPLSELDSCVDSLASSVVDNIFIVDNSSSPLINKWCQERSDSRIKYIAHLNTGYGSAHNVALRLSMQQGVKYHLVLNSDVYFQPDALHEVLDIMEADTSIGTLQPRIVGLDGKLQHTCRMLPTPADLFLRRFLPKSFFSKARQRYLLTHLDFSKPHNIPYHQGSFMFIRLEALRSVGLFDENFFMYAEDIDLTRRIHTMYRTLYVPSPTIVHAHRAESYKSWRMLGVHIVNMCRYFNKWGWWFDPYRRRINALLAKEK